MRAKSVILIVDDQPQNIELLETYLVPQGYEIIKATSGEEALEKLSGNQIDLILLDVLMPGIDGFEVTRRIRQEDKNQLLPIILVTILRETGDRIKGIEAGCDDFLSTPVDKTELLARVQSLLKVKAYNDLVSNFQKELESEVIMRTKEKDELVSKLEKSEEKYRNLFDNAGEAIFVAHAGKIVFLNPRTSCLIGYSAEEIMGRQFTEFIHPDEKEIVIGRHFKRLKGEALPQRYEFRIIQKNGTTLWAELNTVVISWEGKPSTLNFLEDITERKQSQEKLVKSYESVKKTLDDAISTMVKIVELRDPYTAGHQQKVADLATAIAREMKFEDSRIDQLRTAAIIHDIGKIYIPSDILSKPGRLSEIEFSLIKTHAQNGYDIVKGMDFPCGVAQAVLQHHERLDGSGYPNRLKDEDTILESKILAVADVIEAMASNRPYRPALGIDKALEEISKNRGNLYDPGVVDTCLELFHSGKFEFKSV